MLSWAGINRSMKMRETSRAVDKKLQDNNNLSEGGSLRGQRADYLVDKIYGILQLYVLT